MASLEINNNNVQSTEKIEFLLKEIIKLNIKIKDLEIKNIQNIQNVVEEDTKPKLSLILNELNELDIKNINWESLPIVLF